MAEVTHHDSGNRTMIVAIIAVLLIAALAIWAATRNNSGDRTAEETKTGTTTTEQPGGTSNGPSGTVDRDGDDVDLKVNLPDSVTIDVD